MTAPTSSEPKGWNAPMKMAAITTLALIAPAAVAATIALPTPAHADDNGYAFQSPSGNIACNMRPDVDGRSDAVCEIAVHTWVAPPRSPDCHLNWGSRLRLEQGSAAVFACYHQELGAPEQTLDYGQTQSFGTITCDSEPTGVTCIDSGTGHFFRVSRDSYQLG